MLLEISNKAKKDLIKLKKINPKLGMKVWELILDISKNPFEGIGKPEGLKNDLSGYWSRRITQEHRLIYTMEEGVIVIISCFGHY
ncbi:MAG: Txe/YoeB family addiction module toxin [Bacteroidota bacterium]